jgi:hypothetical protein
VTDITCANSSGSFRPRAGSYIEATGGVLAGETREASMKGWLVSAASYTAGALIGLVVLASSVLVLAPEPLGGRRGALIFFSVPRISLSTA